MGRGIGHMDFCRVQNLSCARLQRQECSLKAGSKRREWRAGGGSADHQHAEHKLPHGPNAVPNDDKCSLGERPRLKPERRTVRMAASVQPSIFDQNALKMVEESEFDELYESFVMHGELENALRVVEMAFNGKRSSWLSRIMQKHFLKLAGNKQAVQPARKFVSMLPKSVVDKKTYNLLVSVCVKAKDVPSALEVKQTMERDGHTADVKLYTNLIAACASAGDVDEAFKIYREMKISGLNADQALYGALCQACAVGLTVSNTQNRRSQFVLMERAFNVVDDMVKDGVKPDPVIWNILITCTSRAGQLQRSFEVLQRMQESGCLPDAYTYTSLVEACHSNGEDELALKVYRRALLEGSPHSVALYTAATNACCSGEEGDLEGALEIYSELQRSGLEPDAPYFAALMYVAGQCGNLDLAFALQEDMETYGIQESVVTYTALISASLCAGDLERAYNVYCQMVEKNFFPKPMQVNRLIIECGAAQKMGDVVRLVEDLIDGGHELDVSNYTAIITACHRANEPKLAFAVAEELQWHKIHVDEGICYNLLKACYNYLVSVWYDDEAVSCQSQITRVKGSTAAGKALLAALHGTNNAEVPDYDTAPASDLVERALFVYRRLLQNHLPSMKVLNRMLSCLRVPLDAAKAQQKVTYGDGRGFREHRYPDLRNTGLHAGDRTEDFEAEGSEQFDQRASVILREAIKLGVLPAFSLDGDIYVNMKHMMPVVAEVYVLTVMADVKDHPTLFRSDIAFEVPPFNPRMAMIPSSTVWDSYFEFERSNGVAGDSESGGSYNSDDEELPSATYATSLGVVTRLRRLQIWCHVEHDEMSSTIWVAADELAQWTRLQKKRARTLRRVNRQALFDHNDSDAMSMDEYTGYSNPLLEQQRYIRTDWKD